MKPNWREAMWCLYWHTFYGVPRKDCLWQMIAHGLTPREAIEEMQRTEREPQ